VGALATLEAAGLTLEVVDGDRLRVTPVARLTPELRLLVTEHKPTLVAAVRVRDRWRHPEPGTVRARAKANAAALLAELEALPELTVEQEQEAAYYRAVWCPAADAKENGQHG